MIINKKSKRPKPIQIVARDIIEDIENISDIIEAKIGIKINNMDIIRLLLKTYYEVNNNG